MRRTAAVLVAGVVLGSVAACGDSGNDSAKADTVAYPTRTLQIMAPAGAGGGWDLTARTIQKTLKDAGIVKEAVEVTNVTGAAGTVGLAQLATKHRGDAHQLMITGLVMVGGIVTNKSAVDLAQTTPIATLTAEEEVIVVPAASPHQNLKDLVAAFRADPASVKWGGGSAGGTDQILVGLLAKAAGVDPKKMKYVAYSGGGETKAGLLSGDLTAAVSGASEFKDLVAAGKVRALAVSGAKGVDVGGGSPVPTIKDNGFDVELLNWRGIVAPPGIKAGERAAVVALLDKLHTSPQWQEAMKQQGWSDFYRSGDAAKAFYDSESARIRAVLVEAGVVS
ncbi:C4-dicarboxylate ABC transporter substrate-binding protein [Virgisporangium aliadipatigenens]|uniref:C4-dicarboxylate ABC transporter substrate-binding protein n=1 Tax=Virgisporangium aliadipatigenens TaxID=741659 RepID=A0A8J3YIW7_9ACTN|nr:tripartite tricarboxylate transporter substrate-binding protein [Virgisporangium aliadipatigenens]GIJ46184.1 C4-dicarboxylate ABC transporter substrate-binding protein [Virgisporangium aliadipatigenens]